MPLPEALAFAASCAGSRAPYARAAVALAAEVGRLRGALEAVQRRTPLHLNDTPEEVARDVRHIAGIARSALAGPAGE